MNQEVVEQWTTALRSGSYRQVTGALRRRYETDSAYCCLGVLCELFQKSHADSPFVWDADVLDVVRFIGDDQVCYGTIPRIVREWVGLRTEDAELMDMNDFGLPFSRIADRIEEMNK